MNSRQQLYRLSTAFIIGMVTGYVALFFRKLIFFFRTLAFDVIFDQLSQWLGSYGVILLPVIGGLFIWPFIRRFARETKGHGVPEVLEAVHFRAGFIRPRVVLLKALFSSITIGFGGSVGREGPIVQIGSALGSFLGQLFKVSLRDRRTLVACGAAAAIAATFNAPIAGVFFALEVILHRFYAWSFSYIVISSVTASVISRIYLGNVPAFLMPRYSVVGYHELAYYLLLGLLAAGLAWLYVKTVYWTEHKFSASRIRPRWLKPVIGMGLVGMMGYFLPEIFGVGYKTIELALIDDLSMSLMGILMFAKLLATSLTLGAGGSGGVFAPALFIGVMYGGFMGRLFQMIDPGTVINSAAYGVAGMGAVFAASAQAPLTAILMIFEMTSDYQLILPIMASVGVATMVFKMLSTHSIYTEKLRLKGLEIEENEAGDIFEQVLVKEAMIKDVLTVTPDQLLRDVYQLMVKSKHKGFPVVDSEYKLLGVVSAADLEAAAKKRLKRSTLIEEIFTRDAFTCTPDETLISALQKLGQREVGRLPVVNDQGILIGLLTRKNIIKAFQIESMNRKGRAAYSS